MCKSNISPTATATADNPPQVVLQPRIYFDLLSNPIKNYKQEALAINHKQIQSEHHNFLPTLKEAMTEAKALFALAFPIIITALILYSRSILSMLFLGHLGDTELAGGSLAIAFANITGYSVLSGLALGMEPLCSQAFGAQRPKLLSVTLHRCVIFLVAVSMPISVIWLNMSNIMVWFMRQDQIITRVAHTYLLYSLPDLLTNSFIHPIRIYLRAQGITHPLTIATLAGTVIHFPANFLLVSRLEFGVAGVAAAAAISNLFVLIFLICYVYVCKIHEPTWTAPGRECLTGWAPLLRLAGPSCVSVCLEWWWYEIMIILCGLLSDPKSAVASMGVLIQTTSLIYIFPSSLSLAVSTRVGNELGANRPNKARNSALGSITLAALIGFGAAAFAFVLRDKWGRMFTSDETIINLTSAALPILGLCELGNCPQTVGCGVVRGSARPSTAANVNLAAFYLVGMPVAVAMSFWLGVGFSGLWIGLLSAQVCCAGLMLFVVLTTDWEYQARRAQMLTSASKQDSAGAEKEALICIIVTSS